MAKTFTPETKAAIRHLVVEKGIRSARVVADRLGINPYHARNHIRAILAETGDGAAVEVPKAKAEPVEPEGVKSFETAGDTAKVECVIHSGGGVVGEDDLVRVCGIDLSRWRVVRMRVKAYQTGMKLAEKTATIHDETGKVKVEKIRETPHVVQLFSVSADLERVLPKVYLDGTEALFERLSRGVPEFADSPRPSGPYIATMGLFDVHFAKLCWGRETGRSSYDLRTAETVYRNAGIDLLARTSSHPIKRFLLPIGNDLFHVDSAKNATTSGTPVDTDGRYFKMIEVGSAAVIWLIELLQRHAPVDVFYVPGNHDRLASYHLCREIMRAFGRAPGVTVDIDPNIRKYRRYGCNLFGYRHGDLLSDSQIPTLPGLMADEAPKDWGDTTCRAWFLGHKHTSKRYTTRESDEIRGTRMHWLSALSGTDAWHHENGYVGNTQAAEVYLHSEDDGYAGHWVAPARAA